MATPGFRALREALPGARLVLHLRPGLEPLMAGAPWFDDVIPVHSYHAGARALLREGRALRAHRFDLGLCLPDSISSALLMRAAGVRHVVGYRRGLRGPLLHRAVPPGADWGRRRLVAREHFVLGLVAAAGLPTSGTRLELFTTPCEEARAEKLLAPLAGHGLIAVLAPGASYGASKRWPAASFARVGDALAAAGIDVVLAGAPDEAPLTAAVRAAMAEPALDLAGALDLGTLKALVRRAALVVCNDAAARHVAVAFGVACIALLGPTSLAKTSENLAGVRVVETDVGCRPCYLRDCPIDHRCMTRLEPDRVASVALDLLGGAR